MPESKCLRTLKTLESLRLSQSLSLETSSPQKSLIWLNLELKDTWKLFAPNLDDDELRNWMYKEALIVYQFLEINVERALNTLKLINDKEKRSGFKKVALVLHPDKNKHPQSKEAFQKALNIFNQ